MIRILHTADWHLGQTFFGYDRTQEHEHFLDWLAGVLTKNKIDVLIVAGDVFDVSNPSAASQRMFYRFIHRVTTENPRLQLVVVAGNHDSAARWNLLCLCCRRCVRRLKELSVNRMAK